MPDELDVDRLELLERRLADKVTERVRPALFRLYAAIGGAVVGVLGLAAWDIIADTKKEIQDTLVQDTLVLVTDAKRQIEAELTSAIDRANATLDEAQQEIDRQIGGLEQTTERADALLSEMEAKLQEFAPRASALDNALTKIESLEESSRSLEESLQRATPILTAVTSINEQLTALAEEVKKLSELSSGMGLAPQIGDLQASPEAIGRTVEAVISTTTATQNEIAELEQRPTIYFQYAGAPRGQAQVISQRLKEEGYIVPGEDRENAATGRHEVRYFHEVDVEAANRVAADTSDILQELRYQPPVDIIVKSFVDYRGTKPTVGTIELWIDLPRLNSS